MIGRFAAGISANGFQRGDTLLTFAPNIPGWPVAALGAMAAGGAMSGANPTGGVADLVHQIRDANARFVFEGNSRTSMNKVAMDLASDIERLAGVWGLVSFETETQDTGVRVPTFGKGAKGRLVILASGVMIVVITAGDREPPRSLEDRASAFNSMVAYTGRFTLDGDRLTTEVDVSWNESWIRMPQIRTFRFTGPRLELVSAWQPNPFQPESLARGILSWEREK